MNIEATLGAWSAIIGGVCGAVLLIWTLRRGAAERSSQESRERAALAGEKYAEGARSRDDEIRTLRSERDDARVDRDEARRQISEAKAEAQRWQQAYLEQTRRRGG